MGITIIAVAVPVTATAHLHVSALTPKALYLRLLTSTPRLPAGFANPRVSNGAVTADQRSRGTIGRVDVDVLDSPPGEQDGMIFQVFRTAADARKAIARPAPAGFTREGRIPGYTLPSVALTGSISGENVLGQKVTNGVTVLAAADGNVIVQGLSTLLDNDDSGNFRSARKLLDAARAELKKVRQTK